MSPAADEGEERISAAEVIAALSLATDLGANLPLEHGLESTLVAMRLAERLGVDRETASQTYYACLLFYVGCTADAEIAADVFEDDIHEHLNLVTFGSRAQALRGVSRAVAGQGPAPVRALRIARGLPTAVRAHRRHLVALCEVARLLTDRLGLPPPIRALFAHLTERWDERGDAIPLSVRIVHVARDAALQQTLGGTETAAQVVRRRAGGAFDPAVATALADAAEEILAPAPDGSAWTAVLDREPDPRCILAGGAIDRALAAMGDFADLACPYLVGHSAGVAQLAAAAAAPADRVSVRRAALLHDVGRVAVPVRIWLEPGPLTPDEWERVRLHAYQSERILSRSPFLAGLAPLASTHHERLDGSGYHRGATAAALLPAARVLAAADAYHAMLEPRPHRPPLAAAAAAAALGQEASAGRLDPGAVAAVLDAAGQAVPRMERPAGLTEREVEVVGLLARGLQTKQIARTLGISTKTADRHIQNAYGKIGVSTRAAAALFAMEHGLVAWGELPIAGAPGRA